MLTVIELLKIGAHAGHVNAAYASVLSTLLLTVYYDNMDNTLSKIVYTINLNNLYF